MKTMGSRIRHRRERLGLTQAELARALDVDKGTVWRYETDRSPPLAVLVPKLSEILGVSCDWILTGREFEGKKGAA